MMRFGVLIPPAHWQTMAPDSFGEQPPVLGSSMAARFSKSKSTRAYALRFLILTQRRSTAVRDHSEASSPTDEGLCGERLILAAQTWWGRFSRSIGKPGR